MKQALDCFHLKITGTRRKGMKGDCRREWGAIKELEESTDYNKKCK